jgi:putative restriction endonuclease
VARQNWTREQSILALYLYCQIPFGQIHSTHKQIVETAELIGRSPDALTMKMCNFARFDPELQNRGVSGLSNGSHLDEEIWMEFSSDFSQLSTEAATTLSNLKNQGVDSFVDLTDLPDIPLGDARNQIVRARINQTFFRRALLSSFNYTCCITKIQVPDLLIASHIKPWCVCNESEKTNPRNGLLLNVFHDKAFDLGYFTINKKFELIVSSKIGIYLNNRFCHEWLKSLNGKEIKRPEKFLPSSEFIEYHNDVVFIK